MVPDRAQCSIYDDTYPNTGAEWMQQNGSPYFCFPHIDTRTKGILRVKGKRTEQDKGKQGAYFCVPHLTTSQGEWNVCACANNLKFYDLHEKN
jgi:hypothetical protein